MSTPTNTWHVKGWANLFKGTSINAEEKTKYYITGSSDSSTYDCEPCVKLICVGVNSTLGISRVVTHVKLLWYKDENFRAKSQCAIWQLLLCNFMNSRSETVSCLWQGHPAPERPLVT